MWPKSVLWGSPVQSCWGAASHDPAARNWTFNGWITRAKLFWGHWSHTTSTLGCWIWAALVLSQRYRWWKPAWGKSNLQFSRESTRRSPEALSISWMQRRLQTPGLKPKKLLCSQLRHVDFGGFNVMTWARDSCGCPGFPFHFRSSLVVCCSWASTNRGQVGMNLPARKESVNQLILVHLPFSDGILTNSEFHRLRLVHVVLASKFDHFNVFYPGCPTGDASNLAVCRDRRSHGLRRRDGFFVNKIHLAGPGP